MIVRKRFRRYAPLALLIALLVLLVLSCLCFCRCASSQACASLRPRPPADYSALSAQVERIVGAPAGATTLVRVGERELESYVNYDALPRASIGVASVGISLHRDTIEVALFVGESTCLAQLQLKQVQGPASPQLLLEHARLGPFSLPSFIRLPLSRTLNDTLQTGEVGVTLLSLALLDGEAQVVLSRR